MKLLFECFFLQSQPRVYWVSIKVCLPCILCRSSRLLLFLLVLFLYLISFFSSSPSSRLTACSAIFLKNDTFCVMKCCWFLATTFDPFMATIVYGVGLKLVENLFFFFCLTRTRSPTRSLLIRVCRRESAYRFPLCFCSLSFCLASLCRLMTLLLWGSVGNFLRISRLYSN